MPFSSKGYADAHRHAVNQAIERFWAWSREGELPVVVDTSPCTYGLKTCRPYLTAENQARFDRLTILDAVAFAHDCLLPRLTVTRQAGLRGPAPGLLPHQDGASPPKLEAIAEACAEQVVIPRDAGCCGFAGDRGFLFPELTATATRHEAAEVWAAPSTATSPAAAPASSGVTRATGQHLPELPVPAGGGHPLNS